VSVLVGAGAEIDIVTDEQCTSLHVAAQKGHEAVLAVLIKAGGDVKRTGDDGCSPVYMAVQNDLRVVLAILIKAGADVNQAMDNGEPQVGAGHASKSRGLCEFWKGGWLQPSVHCHYARS